MKIVYLYDMENWAIHNIGKQVQEAALKSGHDMALVFHMDFERNPSVCDVLMLGQSRIPISQEGRRYAKEVVTVIHDPIEISNYSDRFTWTNFPLREMNLTVFDRVGVTTQEMYLQVTSRLKPKECRLLRTYPSVLPEPLLRQPGQKLRIISTARITSGAKRRLTSKQGRFSKFRSKYLINETGKLDPKQLMSIFVRLNRKNPKLLEELKVQLESRNIECDFSMLYSEKSMDAASYSKFLSNADVYVCTSFMEGGPLPVMEAVHAGLAILSTPVGQVPLWVSHGENGYICRGLSDFMKAILEYDMNRDLLNSHKSKSQEIASMNKTDYTAWVNFIVGS